MGSASTLFAGTAIVTGAVFLARYAMAIRRGYRHDPQAKSVWWTPGQLTTPYLSGNEHVDGR